MDEMSCFRDDNVLTPIVRRVTGNDATTPDRWRFRRWPTPRPVCLRVAWTA